MIRRLLKTPNVYDTNDDYSWRWSYTDLSSRDQWIIIFMGVPMGLFLLFFLIVVAAKIWRRCPIVRVASNAPPATADAVVVNLDRERQLREIPLDVIKKDDQGSELEGYCSICMGKFEEGKMVKVLPMCKHRFHRACIDRWLLKFSVSCPVCRHEVLKITENPGPNPSTDQQHT